MKRRLAVFLAVLAVLGLGGGVAAWASIPGPDGTIHGCYRNSNPNPGSLIVIDSAASCPSGYTALNWPGGASVVTNDVHYSYSGSGSIIDIQTATCTSGHPVNGGIIQTTADSGWTTAMSSPTASGNPGGAVVEEAREVSNQTSETSGNANPVDPSLPRPVGTGWKMRLDIDFPNYSDPNQGQGGSFGVTVTLYAVCV